MSGNETARVLEAIKSGTDAAEDIAVRTGLTEKQVREAINRLVSTRQIQRKHLGGYELATKRCALSEMWR